MKRKTYKLLVTCTVITICILGPLMAFKKEGGEYSITEAYIYPVLPGSDEWNEFSSLEERVAACQIPEDILHEMTTDALIESVVSCPIISFMFAHNSVEFGFNQVKGYYNGLAELCKREDAIEELKIYATEVDSNDILTVHIVETLIEHIE